LCGTTGIHTATTTGIHTAVTVQTKSYVLKPQTGGHVSKHTVVNC
jgi:hypothetical protein